MKIILTGGTGLVGRHLIPALLARGDAVACVTRDASRAQKQLPEAVELLEADPGVPGPWQDHVAGADAVVNLAGESLASGLWWTRGKKRRLRRSRLRTTGNLAEAIHGGDGRCVLLSASATGYYGDCGDAALNEEHEPGQDFLAMLAYEWERNAQRVDNERCRVVTVRIGVVLARDGGALPLMLPVFKRGLGGPLGSGRQFFPWIHVRDLVRVFLFALDTAEIRGPVNAVTPDPPRQREFAAALGRAVSKPARLPAPAWALKLLLGQKAQMLLGSQRVVPSVLRGRGFHFELGDLDSALDDLIGE